MSYVLKLAAHAAADNLHEFPDHGFAVLVLDGIHHAAPHMVLEQEERDFARGGGERRELLDDVRAVAVLFDHPLDAPGLALYLPHPLEKSVTVFAIRSEERRVGK